MDVSKYLGIILAIGASSCGSKSKDSRLEVHVVPDSALLFDRMPLPFEYERHRNVWPSTIKENEPYEREIWYRLRFIDYGDHSHRTFEQYEKGKIK